MNKLFEYCDFDRTLEDMILYVESLVDTETLPNGWEHIVYPLLFTELCLCGHAGNARYPKELVDFVREHAQALLKNVEAFGCSYAEPDSEPGIFVQNVRRMANDDTEYSEKEMKAWLKAIRVR